jgi:hypothetical protein
VVIFYNAFTILNAGRVKIPLNIWKLAAYVKLSPMYIREVAHISQMEAGRKIRGLYPRPQDLSSLGRLVKCRPEQYTTRNTTMHIISPKNIPTA